MRMCAGIWPCDSNRRLPRALRRKRRYGSPLVPVPRGGGSAPPCSSCAEPARGQSIPAVGPRPGARGVPGRPAATVLPPRHGRRVLQGDEPPTELDSISLAEPRLDNAGKPELSRTAIGNWTWMPYGQGTGHPVPPRHPPHNDHLGSLEALDLTHDRDRRPGKLVPVQALGHGGRPCGRAGVGAGAQRNGPAVAVRVRTHP